MLRERPGRSRDVGTSVGVCEVVCVGSRKVGGGRVRRNKKVKKDRGDTGALGDSCAGVSERGGGVVVSDAGHPPMEIGGQPANRVMSKCCLRE